ncbi:secretin N-terminal domain-containing protein [Bremerella sp. JC770]|uniref:secretin N-terminal domain-containing protein n=1 Tax=Bremerella sp. JC770 TaxID=3232137 RepID=UPI0034575158
MSGSQDGTRHAKTHSRKTTQCRGPFSLLRRGMSLLVLGLVLAMVPKPLHADGISPRIESALKQRGDLTLRETSLPHALQTISEIWNINVVLGSKVEGTINGTFRDAPLYDILDSLLLLNGYGYRPVGDSLVIVPLSELGTSNPMFRSETIPLEHASAVEIIPAVESLKSRGGSIQAIASANSLTVVDYPDHLEMIRNAVKNIDQVAAGSGAAPGTRIITDVLNYRPEYIDAKSLLEAIQSLISADGRAAVVEAENQVVVIDRPENLRMIEGVLQRLDIPKPQVRITALIYDIDLDDMESLGVDWSTVFKGRTNAEGVSQNVFGLESAIAIPTAAGDPTGVMTFQTLNGSFDLAAVIDAVRQMDDSRLLADPNVVVVNREKAMIQIVTEIPYQQLTQTSAGGDIGTTAFREAGVMLTVTPRIAADGTIEMDVVPSFSRLTGYSEGPNPQPIIDKRETSTTVRVADGQVLVIGGLRQRVDISNDNGIPYLKDIKYVGKLFRYRQTQVRESELVVFLRTEILPCPATAMNCRHTDAYEEGFTKLDAIPVASQYPWPKMSPPPPGKRPTSFGPDPRRNLPAQGGPPAMEGYQTPPQWAPSEPVQTPGHGEPMIRESHAIRRFPMVR